MPMLALVKNSSNIYFLSFKGRDDILDIDNKAIRKDNIFFIYIYIYIVLRI